MSLTECKIINLVSLGSKMEAYSWNKVFMWIHLPQSRWSDTDCKRVYNFVQYILKDKKKINTTYDSNFSII